MRKNRTVLRIIPEHHLARRAIIMLETKLLHKKGVQSLKKAQNEHENTLKLIKKSVNSSNLSSLKKIKLINEKKKELKKDLLDLNKSTKKLRKGMNESTWNFIKSRGEHKLINTQMRMQNPNVLFVEFNKKEFQQFAGEGKTKYHPTEEVLKLNIPIIPVDINKKEGVDKANDDIRIDKRNKVMSYKIMKWIKENPKKKNLIIIVGGRHASGIKELIEKENPNIRVAIRSEIPQKIAGIALSPYYALKTSNEEKKKIKKYRRPSGT